MHVNEFKNNVRNYVGIILNSTVHYFSRILTPFHRRRVGGRGGVKGFLLVITEKTSNIKINIKYES